MNKLELTMERGGNNIIGNYWRVSAWRGSDYLGYQIYAGYTKRESLTRAKDLLKIKGRFN